MKTPLPEEYQRFIAYALIGYLDVVRRTGTGDYHYNFTIGPLWLAKEMANAGVRSEIIALFQQIDEIETLIAVRGGDYDFEALLGPVVALLREDARFEGDPKRALDALLALKSLPQRGRA